MPEHAIFLHVQPTSAPASNGDVAPGVSHPSPSKCVVLMSGFDQTTGRSDEGNPLATSAPTSRPSASPCNRSSVFASSATLLLPNAVSSVLHRPIESAPQYQLFVGSAVLTLPAHTRHWRIFEADIHGSAPLGIRGGLSRDPIYADPPSRRLTAVRPNLRTIYSALVARMYLRRTRKSVSRVALHASQVCTRLSV